MNDLEQLPITTCPFCHIPLTKGVCPLCGKIFVKGTDDEYVVLRPGNGGKR